MVKTCPSAQQLQNLMTGNVDESVLSNLSQHLESCEECVAIAKTLVHNDSLVDTLRSDAMLAKSIAAAVPGPLVDKAKQIARGPALDKTIDVTAATGGEAQPGAQDNDLSFLAPPQAAGEIGRLGQYRILSVLGKGGMGAVFLADDPDLERKVALKVMLPKLAANSSAKQRFLREARIAAKLKSDHIVTIFQVSEDRGVPFLAMELLEGLPLDAYLKAGKKVTLLQVCRIGREIAKGLGAAHEKGLIHRDIKPGNLWLDKTNAGRIKILDFGLARAGKDDIHLTQSGAIVGTPAYMAPEQARGDKEVDHRVDLFSLGCVLYRLCVGEIPFHADTTMGVLLAIATQAPAPPRERNPAIPQALSDFIVQLLHKDPQQRPASAKEVIASLQQIEKQLVAAKVPTKVSDSGPTEVFSPAPELAAEEATVDESQPAKKAKSRPAERKRRPMVLALVACLFASLVLAAASTIYVVTNCGTIEIITDDPNVKVLVAEQGGRVTILDPQSKQTWALNTGLYTIRLDGDPDGLEIELPKDKAFSMKRAGKQVVSIRKVPAFDTTSKPSVVTASIIGNDYALSFAGEQYVDISSVKIDAKAMKAFTIEAWVTIDHSGKQRTLPKNRAVLVGQEELGLKCDLVPVKNVPGAHIEMLAKHAPGVSTNKVPNDGVPVHAAGVFDGQRVSLFINGKLTVKGADYDPRSLFTKEPIELVIGKNFKGTVDEIRISKIARYTTDFTPSYRHQPDNYTLAIYHCDEGEGTVLKDASANGHHGKLVGAGWRKLPSTPASPADFVQALASPAFDWSSPVNLGSTINTVQRELSATLSADERILIFERDQKLWISQRDHRHQPFKQAELLPEAINPQPLATPTLTGDGLLLAYANVQREGKGPSVWLASRKSVNEPFGTPASLGDNALPSSVVPLLSSDGLTLLATTMLRGNGGDIVQYTRKTRTEPFGAGQYVAGEVVTTAFDVADWISNDGLVLIATKMGQRPFETYVYKRPDINAPFGPGLKLTVTENVKEFGRVWLSPDAMRMYFHTRDLSNGMGEVDLWVSQRLPARVPVTNPERLVAEWLLDRKVNLRVLSQGNNIFVANKESIPREPFEIVQAELQNADLDALPWVTKLAQLNAIMVPIKNADLWLEALAKNDRLTMVNAYGSDISDRGLAHVALCSKLDYLNLHGCSNVTAAGLLKLASHKSLRVLNLDGGLLKAGKYTLADLKKLRQTLPQLTITQDESRAIPGLADVVLDPNAKSRFTNKIGMEFVLVPKGRGWLGGRQGKAGDKVVDVQDDFYLGRYEITQDQWQKVMGSNPSRFSRTGSFKARVQDISDDDLKLFPVDAVSWDDCQAFLRKLNESSRETGWYYRLPTSDEWEYACRGGPATQPIEHGYNYYFDKPGNTLTKAQANFKESALNRTCKVGSYQPNKLGLFDMHGNVGEVCQDAKHEDKTVLNKIRGGTCLDDAQTFIAAEVSLGEASAQYNGVGLRVARVRVAVPIKEYTNSLGMKFALVPNGKAWLGGREGTVGDTVVEFDEFYLGMFEVTQDEWQKVMGSNPSLYSDLNLPVLKGLTSDDLKRFPVDQVTGNECLEFVKKLNEFTKETGWVYRLPNEQEWEYACRGGPMKDQQESASNYYSALPSESLSQAFAHFRVHENDVRCPMKVGSYPPNRLGLYDMHGNVWEWCNDAEGGKKKPKANVKRVSRGGSWGYDANSCRASTSYFDKAERFEDTGLRVMRVPVGPANE